MDTVLVAAASSSERSSPLDSMILQSNCSAELLQHPAPFESLRHTPQATRTDLLQSTHPYANT